MSKFVKVAKIPEIPVNSGKCFKVEEVPVAVFNIDGTFYAIHNICSHAGGPLADGFLDGTTVMCPWHGWAFDVTTGNLGGMDKGGVASYPVKVEDDEIWVGVDAEL